MTVKIICIGKIKEKSVSQALEEYIKRINGFCNFEIVELPESRLPENPSQKEIEKALSNEAQAIIKKISGNEYVFSLCIEGKQLSSTELADKISQTMLYGKSTICFVIGSSFGLDQSVKAASDFKLSFSKMTFPHQLMRLILTEQIYRSFTIINNTEYHK